MSDHQEPTRPILACPIGGGCPTPVPCSGERRCKVTRQRVIIMPNDIEGLDVPRYVAVPADNPGNRVGAWVITIILITLFCVPLAAMRIEWFGRAP